MSKVKVRIEGHYEAREGAYGKDRGGFPSRG
jgi:hypothetical protein